LDSQARLDQLYQNVVDKRFVHLATHGFVGSFDQPYSAALALAASPSAANAGPEFLTLHDLIHTWRGRLASCELVVLSACDASKGVLKGDSMMALPWGFMYAGAPSIVASLWKADDLSTSLLMPRFYENILGQYTDSRRMGSPPGTPMSKAQALREAKMWLRSLGRQAVLQLAERGGIGTSKIRSTGGDVDLSDPYYWAGFILLGDPN
jgi:CHAT domain-containing protein